MPILKFSRTSEITLENLRMEDITRDKRTSMLDKTVFINGKYKIDENVYMATNDVFFKMAKIFNRTKIPINAFLIREGVSSIIIVSSKSYVFWNGRCVQPEPYTILRSEESITRMVTSTA